MNYILEVKNYLADQLSCNIEDFEKEDIQFVRNSKQKQPFLKICTMGKSVIVSASPSLFPKVEMLLQGKTRDEIFENPFIYGQSIFYIPDHGGLKSSFLPQDFQYKLMQGEEMKDLVSIKGFENSLGFDDNGNTPTGSVFYAVKDDEIVGMAGASCESETMWELGVDVKPQWRNQGLATALINTLGTILLEQEKLPFYCASTTNIASQAVAIRSGFIPCWVSTYGTILDGSSVYQDVIKKLEL